MALWIEGHFGRIALLVNERMADLDVLVESRGDILGAVAVLC